MKILYTTADGSPQSGAFHNLVDMSRAMEADGIQPIRVLHRAAEGSPFLRPDERRSAYFLELPRARKYRRVVEYLRYALTSLLSVLALARIVRRERPDIIDANEAFDFYAAVTGWVMRIPVVWHVRADYSERPVLLPVLQWLLGRFATRVVPASDSVRRYMCGTHTLQAKVRVVHDPPDYSRFDAGIDASNVRRDLGLEPDVPLVVLVAKLAERKGHITAVRAMPRVIQRHPDARLLLVGGEIDAPHHRHYAQHLRQLPAVLGIEERVVFAGYRSDVADLIAAATIVLHTSSYPDPFPSVVLQGMASGRPVIASALGGPLEQIEDNVTGILVRPDDPGLLAERILELLADPIRREALGRAAAREVRRRFGTGQFRQELTAVYDEVLGSVALPELSQPESTVGT